MLDPLDPSTLRSAREEANLSRAQLATASGVHETTIMRIEKGEVDPKLDGTWAPLARALMGNTTPTPQDRDGQEAA
ncbi:helix-turn-helix domain-containing protein [Novosphingobium colocasiae]|uniref:helix-turn-helix domain-containing protein n=1 Tax=Novosphingobium colocasiae TaxID=1256513 RepID=UPI0035B2BC64